MTTLNKILIGLFLSFLFVIPAREDNEIILQFGPPEISDSAYMGAGYRWNPLKRFAWLKCEAMAGIKNKNVFGHDPIGVFEISPVIEVSPDIFYLRFSSGFAILTGTDYKINSLKEDLKDLQGGYKDQIKACKTIADMALSRIEFLEDQTK